MDRLRVVINQIAASKGKRLTSFSQNRLMTLDKKLHSGEINEEEAAKEGLKEFKSYEISREEYEHIIKSLSR